MIKKIKTLLMTLSITGFMFVPALLATVPAVAHAAAAPTGTINNQDSQLCSGASLSVSSVNSGSQCTNTGSTIDKLLTFVLNIISILVGVTAVIMIVIGGFKYIVSGGESSRVSGAKDTILFAIVGLVVVALAQIIVHFVLSSLNTQGIGNGS